MPPEPAAVRARVLVGVLSFVLMLSGLVSGALILLSVEPARAVMVGCGATVVLVGSTLAALAYLGGVQHGR